MSFGNGIKNIGKKRIALFTTNITMAVHFSYVKCKKPC